MKPPGTYTRLRLLLGWPFLLFLGTVAFLHYSWREGFFMDGLCYGALGRNAAEMGRWLVPHVCEDWGASFTDHPPLFFVVEGAVFSVLGATWTTARIVAVAFALALVLVLYGGLSRTLGRRTAFAGAVLLILTWAVFRWSRVPNLDIPLTLFAALSLFTAYRAESSGEGRWWLLAGLWFGLALWTKGLFALFVPLALFAWLLVHGGWRSLARPWPWLGLGVGLALFALWPLLLASTGHDGAFDAYLRSGFQKSGGARDVEWKYLLRLATHAGPQVVLALFGLRALWRARDRRHVGWLLVCWVLAVLVPLHAAGAKYNHWIVPVYPALAGLGALALARVPWSLRRRGAQLLWLGAPIAALVFACFPAGVAPRRDRELYELVAFAERLERRPANLTCVDDAVTGWLFAWAVSFRSDLEPRLRDLAWLRASLTSEPLPETHVLLVRASDVAALTRDERAGWERQYRSVIRFEKRGLLAAVDRRLVPPDGLLQLR